MKPRLTPGSKNEILNYWPLIGRQWDQFTVNCHFFRVKSSIVSVIILCLPDSVSFETWDTNLFEAFFAYWVSTSVIKLSFINHIEMFLVRYTNGNFGNRELNQKQPWQVLWLQKPFSVQCRALRIAYFNIYKIGNSQCTALYILKNIVNLPLASDQTPPIWSNPSCPIRSLPSAWSPPIWSKPLPFRPLKTNV